MRAAGVGVNLHYIPVYRQPYYQRAGYRPQDFPESERYYAEAISLPMYAGLTERDQEHVVTAMREACVA
jgi:dTDP-4-amino-4,6-dideoxygalactose transaminase